MAYFLLTVGAVLIPFLMGCALLPVMNPKDKIAPAVMLYGWMFLFALFEILAVPCVILRASMTLLSALYGGALILVSLLGGILLILQLRKKDGAFRWLPSLRGASAWTKSGTVLFLILLALTLVYLCTHIYIEGDDAYYVVISQDALQKDSLYLTDPYTGYPLGSVDVRHGLCPMPLFVAFLSGLSGISPLVLCHMWICPVFIMITMGIYALLGSRLLRKSLSYLPLFMLFILAFYLFGHVSAYTAEAFLMNRTWEGKSVFANIALPMFWVGVWDYCGKEERGRAEVLLLLVVLTALLGTTTAVMYLAAALGVLSLYVGIRKKSFREFMKIAVLLIPCLLVGILYLMNKTSVM